MEIPSLPSSEPTVHPEALALWMEARIHMELEQWGQARVDLDHALWIAPDLVEAHLAQAHLAVQRRDLEGADRWFRSALDLRPSSWQAWHGRSQISEQLGELDEAVRLQVIAVERGGDWSTRARLVEVLSSQSEQGSAREALAEWMSLPLVGRADGEARLSVCIRHEPECAERALWTLAQAYELSEEQRQMAKKLAAGEWP